MTLTSQSHSTKIIRTSSVSSGRANISVHLPTLRSKLGVKSVYKGPSSSSGALEKEEYSLWIQQP